MLLNRMRALAVLTILAAASPSATLAQTPSPTNPTDPNAPAAAADPSDRFFDDSQLHDIKLTCNSRDWESLNQHYLDDTYYICDFRWSDQVLRNIGIRSRGTGSRSGVKPGLRVDFDRYTTDQKFLGLKSVILRNNTQDPSGLRERLGMLMFRRMGLKGLREAHARLFVNNAYVGLYTMVESVDKAWLKKNYGENDGYLYEFKYDVGAPQPFVFRYLGADPALYVPIPFKPETHEAAPRPEVFEHDARRLSQVVPNGSAAGIITSPPYAGTYDYAEHQRLRFDFLGLRHRELDAGEVGSRRSFEEDPAAAHRAWQKALAGIVARIGRALAPGAAAAIVIGDSVARGRALYALDDLREALTGDLAIEAWASQERPMLGAVERRAFGDRPKAEHVVVIRRS